MASTARDSRAPRAPFSPRRARRMRQLAALPAWILVAFSATAARPAVGRLDPPRQPRYAPQGQSETIRVLAYNTHHGEGTDGVLDLARIAALIRAQEPDLVALQEIDRKTTRTGDVDQAASYGALTALTPRFGEFMPYQGGEYGMAVLSRWPIVATTNHRLPDGEEPRSALAIRVRSPDSGRELEFVGIHLYRTEAERIAQAEALLEAYRDPAVPVILAGDFNSEPGSEVIRRIARAWKLIDKGADHLTFPSTVPAREIDFFAVRPGDAFRVVSQRVLDEPVASDHRPLWVELEWRLDAPGGD